MVKPTTLEEKIKDVILTALEQNVLPVEIGSFDSIIDATQLSYEFDCTGRERIEKIYGVAEWMVVSGLLKRHGVTGNKSNQEYVLTPKTRQTVREQTLERRLAALEEIVAELCQPNNSK